MCIAGVCVLACVVVCVFMYRGMWWSGVIIGLCSMRAVNLLLRDIVSYYYLELITRLALSKSQGSFCPCFTSAGISGVHHYVQWFTLVLGFELRSSYMEGKYFSD